MPSAIRPMLTTLVDAPFNSREWLFEVKWDGYRALAFVEEAKVRLLSRNQIDLSGAYPELSAMPGCVRAKTAILDGEIVALDEQGRSSFSLMQQRTGTSGPRRRPRLSRSDIPVHYYVFDLLYLDGYSLLRVDLKTRKELLREVLVENQWVHYSEHFDDGIQLYRAARRAPTGRNYRQAKLFPLRDRAFARMAQNKTHARTGMRDRRLHRPARFTPALWLDCARAL